MHLTALEHDVLSCAERSVAGLRREEVDRILSFDRVLPGFCTQGLDAIKLSQYAGIVSLGERVLEVLPKIEATTASADQCRGVLLRLLSRAHSTKLWSFGDVAQNLRGNHLLEIFIAAFFDEVTRIVRAGLLRRYVGFRDDLTVMRGRLVSGRQFGALANRVDRVACDYDELTADHRLNQILKYTIAVTKPYVRSIPLARRWSELSNIFDEASTIRFAPTDLDAIGWDRQSNRYQPAIRWARWILALLSPGLRAGEGRAPSLLFDLNRLFEQAIFDVLLTQLPNARLHSQLDDLHLARLADGTPHVGLRPDLVIRQDRRTRVADTKWKRLEPAKDGSLCPARDDVFQMLAYAVAFKTSHVALIYPWHDALAHSRETTLTITVGDAVVSLSVVCIDVQEDHFPIRRGAQFFDGIGEAA